MAVVLLSPISPGGVGGGAASSRGGSGLTTEDAGVALSVLALFGAIPSLHNVWDVMAVLNPRPLYPHLR